LSKVFGVVDRFSEDIDLSVSPGALGLGDVDPAASLSRTKADKWMEEAQAACSTIVRDQLLPELERTAIDTLGPGDRAWFECRTDEATLSRCCCSGIPRRNSRDSTI
jgi:hypothetical protein